MENFNPVDAMLAEALAQARSAANPSFQPPYVTDQDSPAPVVVITPAGDVHKSALYDWSYYDADYHTGDTRIAALYDWSYYDVHYYS